MENRIKDLIKLLKIKNKLFNDKNITDDEYWVIIEKIDNEIIALYSKEEIANAEKEIKNNYNQDKNETEDEEYNNYNEDEDEDEDEDEEYNNYILLKGVGVKDTENGLKIILVDFNNEKIGEYNIEINIKGYDELSLFDICYNISQEIKYQYENKKGELTEENIKNIIRKEIVK